MDLPGGMASVMPRSKGGSMSAQIRMGVDIGGTFTDVVVEAGKNRWSTKVLTTYAAPEDAIIDGMHAVCAKAGITPQQITQIIHGTTLATNALIERRGAKTALITTQGFRDVVEMRTESRFEQYDLNLVLPDPLLPRNRRYVLPERIDATGAIRIPLDRAKVESLAHQLRDAGYESVAVGFLHSYVNDAHERLVAEVLAQIMPDASVSVSSQVSPQMREYERFNTTIANAYIKPLMASYLGRLRDRLRTQGAACPVFLMHSGGGIMSLENAAAFPVRLVESGPAGGAIFAADLAAQHGLSKVLSFDMGGTTAKICLIKDQTPKTARVFEVARSYRFKKGSGMPISIPVIDMVEIGAGGGSLARVDAMGQIRVGPESAGSEPGPACYGRGGDRPAVTDADLTLGRLDAENFAGGSIRLNADAAMVSLSHLSGAGVSGAGAAFGLSEVVDETMANAARVHAVENGEDLSSYTMIAFGGAAPVHAARLCQKLGIARCLVPQGAGVGSAIGFLRAPFSFEANRTVFMRMSEFDADQVARLFSDLATEATGFVRSCDGTGQIDCDFKVYMRYAGQGWEIPVPLTPAMVAAPDAAQILTVFQDEYAALFGRVVTGAAVEITVWSANAYIPGVASARVVETPTDTVPSPGGTRQLFDPETEDWVTADEFARADLPPGTAAQGPAVIVEPETAVIAPPGSGVRVLADGTLEITVKGGQDAQ